jgi:Carboxypeptidase regulatory-like domain
MIRLAAKTHLKTVVVGLALGGALAMSAWAQAPRQSRTTGAQAIAITGRVVADSTGDPIRNARVTLLPDPQPPAVTLTDGEGHFSVTVPAGRYSVVAGKTGYARGEATSVVAGQALQVRLKKGAAISGRVLDESGDPIVGVRVAALAGLPKDARTIGSADTDDRGEYRIGSLPEGALIVSVTTSGANGPARTTYHPGSVALSEAHEVRLEPGENRLGVDIAVPYGQLSQIPIIVAMGPRFVLEQSPAQAATGIIRGRAISTDGRPVSTAQVFLRASPRADSRATTDHEGRFEFGELPAGRFAISVVKPGFAQLESGSPAITFLMARVGRAIDLAAGEIERVNLMLVRLGAVSGTVTDEYGDPMQGVGVEALQVQYKAGRRRLVPAGVSRVTDDLGRYRLHSLPSGRYIVSAAVGQVSTDDVPGYARSYFPGTVNLGEAQYVSLGLSQDVGSVDLSMPRVPTARVAGTVLSPTGEPVGPGMLTLAPGQRSSSAYVAVGPQVGPGGTFVFPNVAPGQYVIQAYRGRSNRYTEGAFGALPVTVNGTDITGLRLQTSFGSSVTGRFTFDALGPPTTAKASEFELAARPADFDLSPQNEWASAEIHADWTFEMAGLNGPRRLQLLRAPPGWALKEIRVNGIDVTDRPISLGSRNQSLAKVEVVMTDRVTEVRGTVADDRARTISSATVVLFSTDREQWYPASRHLRQTTVGPDGGFIVAGLPSGSYYASAVARVPTGGEDAWQDPQFLDSLVPRASMVSLPDGGKAQVALRLSSP